MKKKKLYVNVIFVVIGCLFEHTHRVQFYDIINYTNSCTTRLKK